LSCGKKIKTCKIRAKLGIFLKKTQKNRALTVAGSTLYNPKKPNENFL
jgi:hypothetical protein